MPTALDEVQSAFDEWVAFNGTVSDLSKFLRQLVKELSDSPDIQVYGEGFIDGISTLLSAYGLVKSTYQVKQAIGNTNDPGEIVAQIYGFFYEACFEILSIATAGSGLGSLLIHYGFVAIETFLDYQGVKDQVKYAAMEEIRYLVDSALGFDPNSFTLQNDGLNATVGNTGVQPTLSVSTGAGDDILHLTTSGATTLSWSGGDGDDLLVADLSAATAQVTSSIFFNYSSSLLFNVTVGGATIASGNWVERINITGGSGDDMLNGYYGNDILIGSFGNDMLGGGAGNDTLDGGAGNDWLDSGSGVDDLDGGDGEDTAAVYRASELRDISFSVSAAASITGETLVDGTHIRNVEHVNLTTGSGDDDIWVTSGVNHTFSTGAGDDILHLTTSGATTLSWSGGDGDDLLVADLSAATAQVTSSIFFNYSSSLLFNVTVGGATIASGNWVERINITGGSGDDMLNGYYGNDILIGSFGNDMLGGGAGNDTLDGGAGNDWLDSGSGVDDLDGGDGEDTAAVYRASELRDISFSVSAAASITGETLVDGTHIRNVEHVNLTTGSGDDDIWVTSGVNHTFSTGAGDDILHLTTSGATTLSWSGGDGDDLLVADLSAATAQVTSSIFFNYSSSLLFNVTVGGATIASGNWVERINITGGSGDDMLNGYYGNDILIGSFGNDMLGGGAGNDTLDGGAGGDAMAGGLGDDTFVVDNVGDTVTEYFGQGIDTVRTTLASYSLGGGVENLVGLLASGQTLNGNQFANAITGAAGNDTLNGYSGNDTLDGGIGADTMYGNLGDDIFYVDNAGDIVREYANQGTDTVRTTLTSYSLGGALENLEGLLGTGQTLIGNQFANAITGGEGGDTLKGYSGNDTLNGGVGADTMYGNLGDDTYFVDNAADVVTEYTNEGIDTVRTTLATYTLGAHLENLAGLSATGQTLKGNNLNNTISGGAGDDRINGSLGADTLSGGAGADTFVFAYYPGSTYPYGVANNDLILDFVSGQDRMELTSSAFPGLSAGNLPAAAFYAGAAAHDGDDRIIYDAATGKLWFDPDGTGGQAAMLFATLGETSHPATIAVSDFVVV